MAENTPAYNPTVEAIAPKHKFCSSDLGRIHLILKIAQLALSFVAFICEEFIDYCDSCGGLYFFEFVSCSAFLLALLMIITYYTPLRHKIVIQSYKKIDFWVTVGVGALFLIASIVFAATMDYEVQLGKVSVAFGFFASFAFIVELWFMHKNNYLERNQGPQTPKTNGAVENEPLNASPPVQESN
ncbi:CKLF-like MARVEL transmembrane domain-containing protein 6 [Anomaloglossus baeobatrachus]|uniref:CKLF-like MARVEL transmembrane domain-containing protein 6 n=1 Tax=Anomaloglossus baeobatrachus TaxID=238106 RepID=UPI003F5044D1